MGKRKFYTVLKPLKLAKDLEIFSALHEIAKSIDLNIATFAIIINFIAIIIRVYKKLKILKTTK